MPNNKPKRKRYPVRCYDNGGKTIDRYTVVFIHPEQVTYEDGTKSPVFYFYVGMSSDPFWPQGFGQHGELDFLPVDSEWRKGDVGKRIPFSKLPEDCQKLVLQDLEQE